MLHDGAKSVEKRVVAIRCDSFPDKDKGPEGHENRMKGKQCQISNNFENSDKYYHGRSY